MTRATTPVQLESYVTDALGRNLCIIHLLNSKELARSSLRLPHGETSYNPRSMRPELELLVPVTGAASNLELLNKIVLRPGILVDIELQKTALPKAVVTADLRARTRTWWSEMFENATEIPRGIAQEVLTPGVVSEVRKGTTSELPRRVTRVLRQKSVKTFAGQR